MLKFVWAISKENCKFSKMHIDDNLMIGKESSDSWQSAFRIRETKNKYIFNRILSHCFIGIFSLVDLPIIKTGK